MIDYAHYGEEGVRALGRAISLARDNHPLQTVTLAVPSTVAGLHLRRRLPLVMGAGLANVRFLPLARAAELIGAPLLDIGHKPLTRSMSAEILRLLLERDESVFTPVQSHPSTVDSLLRAFSDLEGASPDELASLASRGVRQSAVVNLYQLHRQEVRMRAFYSREDLYRAAAEGVRQGIPALEELGRLVLFFPPGLKAHEAAFLLELHRLGRLRVILPVGPDETELANRQILKLLNLTAPPSNIPSGPSQALHLFSVPDSEEEVRQSLRVIMARLSEGVPLYRMAILFRNREPYARICYEECQAAGIPCNGKSVRTLAETMAGRAVSGFLTLPASGFHREELLNWAGASPVVLPGGELVPGASWQQVSRLAQVTRGMTAWRLGLQRVILEKSTPRESDDAAITTEDQETMETAQGLLAFLEQLQSDLDFPQRDNWKNYSRGLLKLLEKYLAPKSNPVWDEDELANLENVKNAIESLEGLHAVREMVPLTEFVAAVEKSLQQAAGRVGSYGTGIFIGTFDEAAAMDFDLACILGMAEGSVPAIKASQPLLTDEDRSEAGGSLASPFTLVERERLRFLSALGTARSAAMFFPRASKEGGRENMPSRWFLEAASALAREPVTGEQLAFGLQGDWFTFIASYQSALLAQPPFSPVEYRVGSLLRHLRSGEAPVSHFAWQEDRIRRAVEAAASKFRESLSPWEGEVRLASAVLGERPVAPTRLETFARCPYQFFLKHVLHVEEIEEPEDRLTMDSRVRGSLYHDILAEFFGRYIGRDPNEPWGEEHNAEIEEIARRHLDNLARNGLAGPSLLWEDQSGNVIRFLHRFLEFDSNFRREKNSSPCLLEADFGENPSVSVQCGDRTVHFCGRPDRVDSAAGGSDAVVIDYKTGWPHGTVNERKHDPFLKGRALQLPVYATAAHAMLGQVHNAAACYLHLLQDKRVERIELDMGVANLERFQEVLSVLVSTLESGLYPANPGDTQYGSARFENCQSCRYDRICPKDREKVWSVKRNDPRLAGYNALQDGVGPVVEESEEE